MAILCNIVVLSSNSKRLTSLTNCLFFFISRFNNKYCYCIRYFPSNLCLFFWFRIIFSFIWGIAAFSINKDYWIWSSHMKMKWNRHWITWVIIRLMSSNHDWRPLASSVIDLKLKSRRWFYNYTQALLGQCPNVFFSWLQNMSFLQCMK